MMTIEDIKNQLKEVLAKSFPQSADPSRLLDDAPLLDARQQMDSIDLLLMVLEIEKKFGIRLVSGEFEESIWTNLNTLAQAIQERMVHSQTAQKT